MTMTNASGQCFFALSATSRMIGRLMRDEVVARLARLARDAGGDDEDVGAGAGLPSCDVPVIFGVVAEDGAVLLEVERLALGEVLLRGDVEEHDVAELLLQAEVRELAADVARANQTDLFSCHVLFSGTRNLGKSAVVQPPSPRNSAANGPRFFHREDGRTGGLGGEHCGFETAGFDRRLRSFRAAPHGWKPKNLPLTSRPPVLPSSLLISRLRRTHGAGGAGQLAALGHGLPPGSGREGAAGAGEQEALEQVAAE